MDVYTYLNPETTMLSKPAEQVQFSGHSWPYFNQVRQELHSILRSCPELALRQATLQDYQRVHSPAYLAQLLAMSEGNSVEQPPRMGIGCEGLEFCLPGYLYSLGGMFEAIDQARQGKVLRSYCFSLGGHHAHADWGHGYCILNPQAAAARYAQENGFAKILIVDWDLHHGDGTQSIFARDPSVHCISIHSLGDLYMAVSGGLRMATTTYAEEIGHCNLPVLADTFGDEWMEQMHLPGRCYRADNIIPAFREAVENIPWMPDYISIFSGYDAHVGDHGRGVMNWTNDDYVRLTKIVTALANRVACPILSVHGGGYELPVVVAVATAHVDALRE